MTLMRRKGWICIVAALLLSWSALAVAGERGWFGFGLKVVGGGFFLNPTVKSLTIGSVAPGSPAARNAIKVGDTIYRIEGVPIAGKKANELKSLAERQVGQTLHVDLKRPSGEVYSVALVAVKRPD